MDRKRNRDTLIADAAHSLNSLLSVGSKYALLDDICWKWSEFDGKIDGCRWWTAAALRAKGNRSLLRHEHGVPRRVIIELLLNLSAPSQRLVRGVLEELCVGAVVTTAEDRLLRDAGLGRRMPTDWDGRDAWARYRVAGIDVIDTGTANG